MQPLTLADLGSTKDPADSVAYDGEGVIELTRRARIRESELLKVEAERDDLRAKLAAAEERERKRQATLAKAARFISELYPPSAKSVSADNVGEFEAAHSLLTEIEASLATPPEAAERTEGERT